MNANGTRARQLLRAISAMSDADRQAMADKMPQVMNPQGHFLTIHNTLLLCQQAQRSDLTGAPEVHSTAPWVGPG